MQHIKLGMIYILNMAYHTCVASIDLKNFYKRHAIYTAVTWKRNQKMLFMLL